MVVAHRLLDHLAFLQKHHRIVLCRALQAFFSALALVPCYTLDCFGLTKVRNITTGWRHSPIVVENLLGNTCKLRQMTGGVRAWTPLGSSRRRLWRRARAAVPFCDLPRLPRRS